MVDSSDSSQQGFIGALLVAVFGVLFVITSILAIMFYSSSQDYKNNVDEKVADAIVINTQEVETAKEAEFVEREKQPTRTYTGSATYGSLSFAYPKTWSIYAEESTSGTVLDLYGFPGVVPGVKQDQVYAVRVEITSTPYDREVSQLQRNVEQGTLRASAFRPDNVPEVLGTRYVGEIDQGVQGVMILLPLRDRTIKIFTEADQYVNDFNTIITPSIDFVP